MTSESTGGDGNVPTRADTYAGKDVPHETER